LVHFNFQTILALVVLMIVAGIARADVAKAMEAYKKGDYAAAFEKLTPLAEAGNVDAQYQLGLMYGNGLGVPKDPQKATEWLDKATGKFDPGAQFNLGVMYFQGERLPKDYGLAGRWFRKAAERGDPEAQYNLGWMYEKGTGVPQDTAEATDWYKKGAEGGFPLARLTLAKMYRDGKGVPQDPVLAYKWAHLAANQKAQEAVQVRDELAKRMTPTQFAEAIRLVHEVETQSEEFKEQEQIQLKIPPQ
jgi:hypothetical protein